MDSINLAEARFSDFEQLVQRVVDLQTETVERWHAEPITNAEVGFLGTVCEQHSFNYRLWHEEDLARCPDADDQVIARVKRAIDGFNQQRNDWIEKIDDEISGFLDRLKVTPDENARLNSETPGSVIDRLSILALRIYHLEEQRDRADATADHRESVANKLAVCLLQQSDLGRSLAELLDDIFSGRKRHRTYRQFKMYNDPTLNPYLYRAAGRRSA